MMKDGREKALGGCVPLYAPQTSLSFSPKCIHFTEFSIFSPTSQSGITLLLNESLTKVI